MKYLIISKYDSMCNFSVCVNGKVYEDPELFRLKRSIAYQIWDIFWGFHDVKELVLDKFGKKFSLIVLCEDGRVEVWKNE